MAGATWSWTGGAGSGGIGTNWALVGGTGTGGPQSGDSAIVTDGTVQVGSAQFVGNTVEIGGINGTVAAISFVDTSILNLSSPSLDGSTVITNAVPGQSTAETTVLNIAGTFVNDGTIIANGPSNSTLVINIQPATGSVITPGYFLNSSQIEVDPNNTLTISIAATAELLNPSLIRVHGGTLDIIANAGANSGGYAPVRGTILIDDGGAAELNAGAPAGTSGVPPHVVFGSGTGNLLKLDQPGQFPGRIDGFAQGNTIDIGTLAVTGASYSANGLLTLMNGSTTEATLALWTGGFTVGSFAVSGGAAGSFDFSTAPNGDTLITTNYANSIWNSTGGSWNTASAWSGNAIPGANAAVEIGNGNNTTFTLTTGSSAQAISSLLLGDNHATLQVTNALTVTPQPIDDLAGTLEITAAGTLWATGLLLNSGGAALLMDPGSVMNLTGHANYGFENAGTITQSGNSSFAASLSGGGTINGGRLNAGYGTGGGAGGNLNLGHTGGNTPTSLLVENSGQVTDTFSVLSSNPFDFASLTIDGSTWNDSADPTDTITTRGYMLVGNNDLGGSMPIAGSATLTLQNNATLTESSRAFIGYNSNSGGIASVTSGAVWDVGFASGGFLGVGYQGNGALTISGGTVEVGNTATFMVNGTTQTGGGVAIARQTGSTGTITVESGGLLNSLGGLSVGRGGQGTLDVLGGGSVSVSSLGAGFAGSASASIVDSGGGAALTASQGTIGVNATAVMNVAGSAVASFGTLQLGSGSGGQGTLTVGTGGSLAVTGNAGIANRSTLVVSDGTSGVDIGTSGSYVGGAVNVESGHTLSGTGVIAAAVQNSGQIQAVSGTLEVTGSVTTSGGSGTLAVGNNAVLRLDSSVDAGQVIDMGTGSELILNAPGSVIGNAISGLSIGDRIALNLGSSISISSVNLASGTLTVVASNGTYELTNVSLSNGTTASFGSGFDPLTNDNYVVVQPAVQNWIGAVDTSFSTAGNWSPGNTPNSTTSLNFVTNPGTVTGNGSALYIAIGNNASSTPGTWTLAGGSIAVSGQPNAGTLPNSLGFFANTVLNAETVSAAGGTTNIGGSGGVATVTAQGGAQVTTAGDTVGGYAGQTGSLAVTGIGTDWIEQSGSPVSGLVPGYLALGLVSSADGVLGVSNGATLSTGGSALIGANSGGSGTATIASGGIWTVGGALSVGNGGAGTLAVNGGTLTASGGATIGGLTGSTGSVDVTGTGIATVTGSLAIGNSGTGSLTVEGSGGLTATGVVVLGNAGGSSGVVNVTAATASMGSGLAVGGSGSGALTIGAGGVVTTGSLEVGTHNGGSGTISVSGTNSSLSTTGTMVIGASGTGNLSAASGADVTIAADLDAGTATGGSGTINVNPLGTVTVDGNLNLGAAAASALNVGLNASLGVKGVLDNGLLGSVNQYGTIDPAGLNNAGSYSIDASQTLTYDAFVANQSQINVQPGVAVTLETPQVTNGGGADGTFNIGTGNASLTLDGDIFSGQTIAFTDGTGTLTIGYDNLGTIETPSAGLGPFTSQANANDGLMLIGGFTGVISGYATGDRIVVDTTQAAAFAQIGSVVEVIANSGTLGMLTFATAGQAGAAIADSAIADQQVPPPCFAAGTRIRTARGDVAVEELRAGDRVWSVLAEAFEPVRWIGNRAVNCGAHPRPEKVWPVRVSAGAFGAGLPVRDLVLSPDHALYVNEVLIPVKRLANGTTIRQVPVDTVTYYHVELPAHDVLLAEGLPAESYLDVDDRSSFSNGGGAVALHPDFAARRWELRWEAEACAPFYVVGPRVDAARAMVAALAGEAGRAAA